MFTGTNKSKNHISPIYNIPDEFIYDMTGVIRVWLEAAAATSLNKGKHSHRNNFFFVIAAFRT